MTVGFKCVVSSHRFERLKRKDPNFEKRYSHLGNMGSRNGVTEFNWDGNLEDVSNEHRR